MTLYDISAVAMINSVNTTLGTQACIEFYTTGGYPTGCTSVLGATALFCSAAAMTTPTTGATQDTGAFNTIATATVAGGATQYLVEKFAIWNIQASTNRNTTNTVTNVVLTGTVGTTTGDITFNTNLWSAGDNIQITSLTFVQPK